MKTLLKIAAAMLTMAALVYPVLIIGTYDAAATSFPLWSVMLMQALPISALLLCAALLFAALGRIIRLLEEEKKEKCFGPHI